MEDLRICFDTGHAHMTCGVQPAFQTLKERVVSSHVHDNRHEKDDHLLPFDGEIDWEQTIRSFRAAGAQFPLLFEIHHYGAEVTNFARLREAMERIESIH